ncbi:hypothetical protein JCM15831A_03210 [Asaia astilbis]
MIFRGDVVVSVLVYRSIIVDRPTIHEHSNGRQMAIEQKAMFRSDEKIGIRDRCIEGICADTDGITRVIIRQFRANMTLLRAGPDHRFKDASRRAMNRDNIARHHIFDRLPPILHRH